MELFQTSLQILVFQNETFPLINQKSKGKSLMLVTKQFAVQLLLNSQSQEKIVFQKNFFRIFTFENQKKMSPSKNELKEEDQKQKNSLDMESMCNKCLQTFRLRDQRLTNKVFILQCLAVGFGFWLGFLGVVLFFFNKGSIPSKGRRVCRQNA